MLKISLCVTKSGLRWHNVFEECVLYVLNVLSLVLFGMYNNIIM